MGKNLKPQFSFRTDKEIIRKIEYIAKQETRNRNQQVEHLLKKCVEEFEQEYGKLIYNNENDEVILANELKEEKSSGLKIG